MRLATLSLAILLVAGVAVAEPRLISLSLATVPTNATVNVATAATTNGTSSMGYVHGLYLDFGGYASPTCDVDVVVVGGLGAIERTIFSADDVAADVEYYTVEGADTTAGGAISNTERSIPLFANDKLVLRAYDANVTNAITLKVYVYLDDQP